MSFELYPTGRAEQHTSLTLHLHAKRFYRYLVSREDDDHDDDGDDDGVFSKRMMAEPHSEAAGRSLLHLGHSLARSSASVGCERCTSEPSSRWRPGSSSPSHRPGG